MTDATIASRLARVASRFTLRLTHHGRRSGTPYRVTIWFVADGDVVWLGSADRRRQWVRNVRARPDVVLEIGDERFTGRVEALDDRARATAVEHIAGKYWFVSPLVWLHRRFGGDGLGPYGTALRVRLDG